MPKKLVSWSLLFIGRDATFVKNLLPLLLSNCIFTETSSNHQIKSMFGKKKGVMYYFDIPNNNNYVKYRCTYILLILYLRRTKL